jgi:hypothetical protein
MRSKAPGRLAVLGIIGAAIVCAQDSPLPSGAVKFNLSKDSPVSVLSNNIDQSRASMRGAAMVLDLHMALTLRNDSPGRIHGVTLRVVSQEVAMGGKGSVTIPSLNIAPHEVFPVRIDMQLVRPTQIAGGGPLVQVDLDGVLFNDLSFYGPDRLNSKRYLTACELEAQRDREHFKKVLAANGKEGLRREIIDSLQRQSELQPLTVKVRRGGAPMVSSAALAATEHMAEFAFLQIPDSPVEPVQGWAQISGNEARAPSIQVHNKSGKPVKYVELGWIVSDQAGKQYMAASLPSSEPGLYLPAGQSARVLQESTLNFTSNGQPVNIRNMTGFVNQVEFADGKVWVPNRQNLNLPVLQKVLAPSAEELRLSNLYRRKGLDALVDELKNY